MSESRKRPVRRTKAVQYEESMTLSSDEEETTAVLKKKRRKCSDDESFSIETEGKAAPSTSSRIKKKTIVKKITESSKSKRIKLENPKIESDSDESPIKKIKIEENSTQPSLIKVKPLSELMIVQNENTDQNVTHWDTNMDSTSDKVESRENLDQSYWYCVQCNFRNNSSLSLCSFCRCNKPPECWTCPNLLCKAINYPHKSYCHLCTTSKSKDHSNMTAEVPNSVPSSNSRFGDWVCPKQNCALMNFSWRKNCFKCNCDKPFMNQNDTNCLKKGDWYCACGKMNFAWRNECFLCHTPKPRDALVTPQVNQVGQTNATVRPTNVKTEISSNISATSEPNRVQSIKGTVKKEFPATSNVKIEPNMSIIPESKMKSESAASSKAQTCTNIKKELLGTINVKKEPKTTVKAETLTKNKLSASQGSQISKNVKIKLPGTSKVKIEPTKGVKSEAVVKNESKALLKVNVQNMSNPLASSSKGDDFYKVCCVVSKKSNIPLNTVQNVIKLFNSEATVPFIVRYRSHLTGGLTADELRLLKQRYESTLKLLDKQAKLKKKLESSGYLDPAMSHAIDSCVTQQELDYLAEPFKVMKTSKLVKVIDLGLSTPANDILCGRGFIRLERFVKDDLNLHEITDLMVYYVGEIMSKDSELLGKVREFMTKERILLQVKQRTTIAKTKTLDKAPKRVRHEDAYSNYYNFSVPYDRVKPYQILAINRGESEQRLTVTLDIPNNYTSRLNHFARTKWYFKGAKYELREEIFNKGLEVMNKKIIPYVKRTIRNELTKQGEKASLEVFSSNLKNLLLTQPVRNMTVLALDPGFSHGCKVAILSPQQEILKTEVLFLSRPEHFVDRDCLLVRLINEFNVDLLVVGNGVGCRDVELKISYLIDKNCLRGNIKYVVASENGISVYSCSPEAAEEYPNLLPNLISAISLAKRIQDPLCELVKVEPKHLGVGMYQHDINEKKLDSVLSDVVSECVSIVGVDVNTAPLILLKRVSGLTESRAKSIIEAREKSGAFIHRDEIKDVKGIGPKTFQQCAGFIKIIPATISKKYNKSKAKYNPFDQTIIHPEDYATAKKILFLNNLQISDLGTRQFIEKIKSFTESENLHDLSVKFNVPFETIKLILEALSTPLDYDIRSTFDKPLFRNKATSINDLAVGSVMSGRVENVTHFGAFVDLGVSECNGLIHTSKMAGKDLNLGQIVQVKINEVDTNKMRIGLSLVCIS